MRYFFIDGAESAVRHRYQKMFVPRSGLLQRTPDGRMYLDFCNISGTYASFAEQANLVDVEVRRTLQSVDARLCWEWLKQGGTASFVTSILDSMTYRTTTKRFHDSLTPSINKRLSPFSGLDTICMSSDVDLLALGFSNEDVLLISDRLLHAGLSLNSIVVKL